MTSCDGGSYLPRIRSLTARETMRVRQRSGCALRDLESRLGSAPGPRLPRGGAADGALSLSTQ